MDFLTTAKNRYTTKKYNNTKKIAEETINELKSIIALSPSSINSQPWNFHFISNETVKQQLAKVSFFNEPKINDASHLVVFSVIDNLDEFEAQIQQYLPEGSIAYYQKMIKPKPEAEIKAWLQSQVYLSLGFFLSACASMDIDSSPMEGIINEEYDTILNLNGYKTLFAVAIGYRDDADSNQPTVNPKSRLKADKTVFSI